MSESVTVSFSSIYGFIPDSGLLETSNDHIAMLLGYRGVVRKDVAQVRITINEGGTQLYQKTLNVTPKAVAEKRTITISEVDYTNTPLVPSKYKAIVFDETQWTAIEGQPSKTQVGNDVVLSVSGLNNSNYLVLKIAFNTDTLVTASAIITYKKGNSVIQYQTQNFTIRTDRVIYILLPWDPGDELTVHLVWMGGGTGINPDWVDATLYDTGQAKDTYTTVDVVVDYLDSNGNTIGTGSASIDLYLAILKKVESTVTPATIIGLIS